MRNTFKSIATSTLWVGLAVTAMGGNASGGPFNVMSLRGLEPSSLTDQVDYRRNYRGGYYRRGYNPGAAAAAAAVGAVGAAAAAGAYPNPYYGYPPYADFPAYAYPYDYGW